MGSFKEHNGNLEFDVIIDGKYDSRVSEGALFHRDSKTLLLTGDEPELAFEVAVGVLSYLRARDLLSAFNEWLSSDE